MKHLLVLGILAANSLCHAADVTAFVTGGGLVPPLTLAQAQRAAASMFEEIGIRVVWAGGRSAAARRACPDFESFPVQLSISEAASATKREFGRALPFARGGTRVTVFYDRSVFDSQPLLLAHVLVHEIAHVLQGLARHSLTGLMKASFTDQDFYDMQYKRLAFTPLDRELIHQGMAAQQAVNSCTAALR